MIRPIRLLRSTTHFRLLHTNAKDKDPLRIAFFGSDHFSSINLKHLLEVSKQHPEDISHISLITRNPKRTGRNLKNFTDPIIVPIAKNENIEIIRAETNDEMDSLLDNEKFNIVISVSYGNLISSNLINNLKYGGLNVHPSLLPKYTGSSPLQYALLNNDKFTGVTVQTLHPTKFDRGAIISQSPEIPIDSNETIESLGNKLAIIGSKLLGKVCRERLFLNIDKNSIISKYNFSKAYKLKKDDSRIIWEKYDSETLQRRNKILGPLFVYVNVFSNPKDKNSSIESTRLIIDDITAISLDSISIPIENLSIGEFFYDESTNSIIIKTLNGLCSVKKLQWSCDKPKTAENFMLGLKKKGFANSKLQFN